MAKLLLRAGKRPVPSPEAVARIHARVHAEWQAATGRRRRQRWFALAASILVVAVGSFWMLSIRERLPAAVVARIERGELGGVGAHAGSVLMGDRIETAGDGGVVLRTLDARGNPQMSMRLAPGSALHWAATSRVELLRGGLYVDSEGHSGADGTSPLVIEAAGARVEHLGTRYLTQTSADHVDVLVRDGMVRIQAAAAQQLLGRGEQGRVRTASDGNVSIERSAIDPDGAAWAWVDALAPRVALEGQNLRAVALLLAREAGVELHFESSAVEAEAATTILHGPMLELPPGPALQAVLSTTRFEIRRQPDGSRLLVRTP